MSYRHVIPLLLGVLLLLAVPFASAQDNLLENPGFENAGSYVDQAPADSDQSYALAPGWRGYYFNTPSTASWQNIDPIAFPHSGSTVRNGFVSQNIGRGDATFTSIMYQTVDGIAEGTRLKAEVWVFQDSEQGSGSRTRVGIGSNVGTDVNGSPITWSQWMTSIDSWQIVSVEATVPAGSVTMFIQSTQFQPKTQNQNYYDDAALTVVGEGDVDVGGDGGDPDGDGEVDPPAVPTSTPQVFVPFVDAQEGGEIHTVQTGDTVAAIAVAYGISIDELLQLNNLTRDEARFLRIGQQLIVRAPSPETEEPTPEPEPEVTDAAQDTDGFASPTPQEVAQEATDAPTAEVTEEVTEEVVEDVTPEPTPDVSPTPTEIPATPTDAPTAPVETGADTDPLAVDAGLCVVMFDDGNSNNIQDAGEAALAGGQIDVIPSGGGEPIEYIPDGSEPFCFEEIEDGLYTVQATAPDGYGLARSALSVSVQPGQQFTVRFAAVEGLEVAAAPTIAPESATQAAPEIVEEPAATSNNLRNIAGIIVLGLAGVVLVGGIAVAFIANRS